MKLLSLSAAALLAVTASKCTVNTAQAQATDAYVPTGYEVTGAQFYRLNSDNRVVQVTSDCKNPAVFNNPETRDLSCLFSSGDDNSSVAEDAAE